MSGGVITLDELMRRPAAHRRLSLRERAVRLPYIQRRVLFADLARSLIFGGDAPRNGSRPPEPHDICECLIADVYAVARPSTISPASTAAQCADSAFAERQPDAGAPERAPAHYGRRK